MSAFSPNLEKVADALRQVRVACEGTWQQMRANIREHHARAVSITILLNVVFVLVILWGLGQQTAVPEPRELQVTLYRLPETRTLIPLKVDLSQLEVQPPPDVIVQNDSPSTAPVTASQDMVLAPRPDPKHANPSPSGPQFADTGNAILHTVMRILVMPDGSVGDAQIVQSCGRSQLDNAAALFVKSNWKLLPALLGTSPIQYWTTVTVPIGTT